MINPEERSLAVKRLENDADTFGKKLVLAVLKRNAEELFKFVTDHADDFGKIPHDRHLGVLHVLATTAPAFVNTPWDLPPGVFKALRGYYPDKELAARRAVAAGTDEDQALIKKLVETVLRTNAATFAPEFDPNHIPELLEMVEKSRKQPQFKAELEKAMRQCGKTFGVELFRATLAGTDAAMLDFARKHRDMLPRVRAMYYPALLHAMSGELRPSWAKLVNRSPEWKNALEPMVRELRGQAKIQLDGLLRLDSFSMMNEMLQDASSSRLGLDTIIYFNPGAGPGLIAHLIGLREAAENTGRLHLIPSEVSCM